MKITKQRLKKLIKEELEALFEAEQSALADLAQKDVHQINLTQKEANKLLLDLEELMSQPEQPDGLPLETLSLLYDKILDAGIGSGFGGEPTEEPTQRKGIGDESYEDTLAAYKKNPSFFN
jgi:hypothetical protein